ncbi:MAG: hypothetical protein Kow0069_07190 [Promethearchaeota archaeon]
MGEDVEAGGADERKAGGPSPKVQLVAAFAASFVVAWIGVATSIWQLALVAGVVGGACASSVKVGASGGLLGVLGAWGVNAALSLLTKQVGTLMEQLGSYILGSPGMGFVLVLLALLVGAAFGMLGGAVGGGVRALLAKPPQD